MAKPEDIKQIIRELNVDAIFIKGFDKALHGTGKNVGGKTVAVYNADDCLQILVDEHEMGEIEAWDHFNSTVVEGTPGPNKPIFISDWRWAINIDQVLKDIQMDKDQTISDILDEVQRRKEEEENRKKED